MVMNQEVGFVFFPTSFRSSRLSGLNLGYCFGTLYGIFSLRIAFRAAFLFPGTPRLAFIPAVNILPQ
jgi:hypothetical protein